jgi:hypothetical protein
MPQKLVHGVLTPGNSLLLEYILDGYPVSRLILVARFILLYFVYFSVDLNERTNISYIFLLNCDGFTYLLLKLLAM